MKNYQPYKTKRDKRYWKTKYETEKDESRYLIDENDKLKMRLDGVRRQNSTLIIGVASSIGVIAIMKLAKILIRR